jgi:hypothetical protein
VSHSEEACSWVSGWRAITRPSNEGRGAGWAMRGGTVTLFPAFLHSMCAFWRDCMLMNSSPTIAMAISMRTVVNLKVAVRPIFLEIEHRVRSSTRGHRRKTARVHSMFAGAYFEIALRICAGLRRRIRKGQKHIQKTRKRATHTR